MTNTNNQAIPAEHASSLTAECTPTPVTAANVTTYAKDDISPIIEKCIKVALEEFDKQITILNARLTSTEAQNKELKERLDAEVIKREEEAKVTSERLCQLEKKLITTQKELGNKKVSNDYKNHELEINDLEQYSRRSHIRIRGLEVRRGETYKAAVVRLCSTKLHVPIRMEDLDAAHPLPQSTRRTSLKQPLQQGQQQQSQQTQQHLPNIIARFHGRDQRDAVIKARSILKGTRTVVSEDLTAKNQDLLRRLGASKNYTSSWSWMGKIYAIPRGEKNAKKMSIMDNIPPNQ